MADHNVMQVGSVMPIHIESLRWEHERALPAAISRSKSLPLDAPCFVFSHHGFVFEDGVGGAVADVFPRGRKSMAEEFGEAVRSRQSSHLKEVRAKKTKTSNRRAFADFTQERNT